MISKIYIIVAFVASASVTCKKIEMNCITDDGFKCRFFNVQFNGNTKVDYKSNHNNVVLYPAEMKTYIEFIESQLERIPPELFLYYTSVREFLACGVELQVLDEQSFYGAHYMEIIDVSSNGINVLSSGVFSNVSMLLKLNLSKNQIQQIERNAFNGLHRLRLIDLSYNEIEHLQEGMFKGQGSLEVLVLDNNKIRDVLSNAFHGLYNILYISLQHNRIKYIAEGAFESLPRLEYLKLSKNYLKTFNLPHYAHNVYLSYNFLTNVTINPNIYLLDIQHNNITDVKCQSENSAIEILLINNNKLYNLHCIDSLKRLKILHAGTNQLQFVSRTEFQNLIQLEMCNLNGNHIINVDVLAFGTQKKLIFLDLSCNRLKELNVSNIFSNENVIETLLLVNNEIQEINMDNFYKHFKYLKLINLKGNPYNCSSMTNLWLNVSGFTENNPVKEFQIECD